MATTAKRSGTKTTARKKTAGAKTTAALPRRGASGKARQQTAAPKRRRQPAKAKTPTRAAARSASSASAAKKSTLKPRKKTAQSRRKPVPAKKTHRRMSPQARKNLVAKRLREMLEEKNRRAAQTPAWQQIVHHDHPAPMPAPHVPEGAEVTPPGQSSPVATVRGNRDRGSN